MSKIANIPSRVSLSIIAALSGIALTYRLMAWGILPVPSETSSPLSDVIGVLALLVLVTGWVFILRRRPK